MSFEQITVLHLQVEFTLSVNANLSYYRIAAKIGAGVMGEVFR